MQVLLTGSILVLDELRRVYGVQAAVLPVVENEMLRDRRVAHLFRKSLGNRRVVVLTDEDVVSHFVASGHTATSARAIVSGANATGDEYFQKVDMGEAYTLAFGVELGFPVLSHDFAARRTLRDSGLPRPDQTLRLFDLLVFGLQVGCHDVPFCDRARQTLLREDEYVPPEFMKASFGVGMTAFPASLVDGAKATVGPVANRPLVLRQ